LQLLPHQIPKKMWSGLLFKHRACGFNRDSRKRPLVCGIQPNVAIEWTEVLSIQIIRLHESHVLTTQNYRHSKWLRSHLAGSAISLERPHAAFRFEPP
jgi:hypothetical protein